MNLIEFYEKYKGHRIRANIYIKGILTGIVCGHGENCILFGIDRSNGDTYSCTLERFKSIQNRLVVYKPNPDNDAYVWMSLSEFMEDLESPIIESNNDAELYVKTKFPNLSDDDTDIYINIFIAGTNSVKSRL